MIDDAQRGGVGLILLAGLAALFDAGRSRGKGALHGAAAAHMPL